MTFYEFHDKPAPIPKVVVLEGNDSLLAQRALALLVERVVGPGMEALNVDRFEAAGMQSFESIASALASMPFMGNARLVVVRGAHELRADPRRALAKVAQEAPAGNVLAIEDLRPGRARGETFGSPGDTLRLQLTADAKTRARFARETLVDLGGEATPAAHELLSKGDSDLLALRTDIEKLTLLDRPIEPADVERELTQKIERRASHAAAIVVEAGPAEAYRAAADFFEEAGRNAAFPLLAAVATDCLGVWELARRGGALPARLSWRERALRPVARQVGEAGARRRFERAIRALEALVTGKAKDGRVLVDLLIATDSLERNAP
ncbi:MAG: hypothetical protein ABI346_03165 [Candidatus Baltobacteraceae bacterium]